MPHQCTQYILMGYHPPSSAPTWFWNLHFLLGAPGSDCLLNKVTIRIAEITHVKHLEGTCPMTDWIRWTSLSSFSFVLLRFLICKWILFQRLPVYLIGEWWRRRWQPKFSLPCLHFQTQSFCLQGKQSPSGYRCHFKTILWKCSLLAECGGPKEAKTLIEVHSL